MKIKKCQWDFKSFLTRAWLKLYERLLFSSVIIASKLFEKQCVYVSCAEPDHHKHHDEEVQQMWDEWSQLGERSCLFLLTLLCRVERDRCSRGCTVRWCFTAVHISQHLLQLVFNDITSVSPLVAGITAETYLLLEHAFCGQDAMNSTAPLHEETALLLLVLPCLTVLLFSCM